MVLKKYAVIQKTVLLLSSLTYFCKENIYNKKDSPALLVPNFKSQPHLTQYEMKAQANQNTSYQNVNAFKDNLKKKRVKIYPNKTSVLNI